MKLRPIRPTAKIKRKKPPFRLKAAVSRAASRRPPDEYADEEEYYEAGEPNMKLSHAFIVVLILHLVAVAGVFGFNSMKNRQSALARISAEAAVAGSLAPAGDAAPAAATSAPRTAAAASAPEQPAREAGKSHEVVPGDTLTKIAALHGTSIEAIVRSNGLEQDSVLRVGQKLTIPEAAPQPAAVAAASPPVAAPATPGQPQTSTVPPATSAAARPAPTATTSAPAAAGETAVYEVVAGDNPYSIAKRHSVSYQELLEMNGITDPTKLQIGQKLKIPASR